MTKHPTRWWCSVFAVTTCIASGASNRPLGAQQTVAAGQKASDDTRAHAEILTRRVTVTLTNVSRATALVQVAREAKVFIAYQVRTLEAYPGLVSIHAKALPLGNVIEQVLAGTGLHAIPDGQGGLLVKRVDDAAPGDSVSGEGIVTGRVVDSATGRGIAGVTVAVTGTKLAMLTQDDGRFTLAHVPAGERVVTAKLFGYHPESHPIDVTATQSTTVRFVLTSMPNVLSGVITTATGVQRKIDVGNDITVINADSVMRTAPIHSVTDLLEARVPGLTVTHSSGDPGNPSRIRLRGASSITGNNDPIVIVDGVRVYANQSDRRNSNLAPSKNISYSAGSSAAGLVTTVGSYAAPSPLDQIDPNSIETIEVFKGPSASSQYGADAANGVIVVTTKKGRAGPSKWYATLGQGINWIPGDWPNNYYRFGLGAINQTTGSPFCAWNDVSCYLDSVVTFQALNDPRYTVFSHGTDQTASLSVSGGTTSLRYSLTGTGTNTTGNLKLPAIERQRYEKFYGDVPNYLLRPDKYRTWGISGQVTAEPMPAVDVTLTNSLYNGAQQQGSLQQAIPQLAGVYIDPTQLASTPLIQNDVERATDDQQTSTTVLSLNWRAQPWLPLHVTGGLSTVQRTDVTYIPFGVNSCAAGGVPAIGQPANSQCSGDTTGHYGYGHGSSQDKTGTINTQIPLQLMTLGIGADLHVSTTSDFSAATEVLSPGVSVPTTFCQGQSTIFGCGALNTTALSTYGWFVEPRITIGSRIIVAPGFRLDGGSASGSNAGLTGFPKTDVSYIAVDESRPWGPVSLFRPRLAFGYAGTQPNPTQRLRLLNANNANQTVSFDGGATFVPIVQISTIGNTQLHPERKRELETGADLELWHGRLATTYSYYNTTRIDAIIAVPVAPSVSASLAGSGQLYTNIGVVRNTGSELSLTAQLLQTRAIGWSINGNVSANTNRVVRLNPGQSNIGDGTARVAVGYPLWGIWMKPIASFADANGDQVIEPTEIRYGDSSVYVGQADPKYQTTIGTNVTLLNGRLSIHATFEARQGMTQFNANVLNSGTLVLLPNTPGATLATQAGVVAAGGFVGTVGAAVTDLAVMQSVNTFRFNDLSINYALPTAITRHLRVPTATVLVQGSNLGLHTNYRGKDPGVNVFATSPGGSFGDLTVDAGQVPQPRLWRFMLSLGN